MTAALLAVDVGLRTGLALYGPEGRLVWYRSRHLGRAATHRRFVAALLRETPGLRQLALEGGGPLAEQWAAEAERLGIAVLRVPAETWRARLLPLRERRSGADAKRHADAAARRVIEWSGAPRPTSLRHDAAEAILAGLCAAEMTGLLPRLPREVTG